MRTLGVFLNGDGIHARDPQGMRIVDDSFYWVMSAQRGEIEVTVPASLGEAPWMLVLDTSSIRQPGALANAGERLRLSGPVSLLFQRLRPRSSLLPGRIG